MPSVNTSQLVEVDAKGLTVQVEAGAMFAKCPEEKQCQLIFTLLLPLYYSNVKKYGYVFTSGVLYFEMRYERSLNTLVIRPK